DRGGTQKTRGLDGRAAGDGCRVLVIDLVRLGLAGGGDVLAGEAAGGRRGGRIKGEGTASEVDVGVAQGAGVDEVAGHLRTGAAGAEFQRSARGDGKCASVAENI